LRSWLLAAAGATLTYLGAVAIITIFQPTGAGMSDTLLDLTVRQQGQVLLSGYLSLLGVAALIAGLRRDLSRLRSAALVLLLATVAKVFLYDLSMLTSLYRVASFVGVGLLLLAGAFAYQRLRPPATRDLREVRPSGR
jgi:uncharacterized membrane protein